MTAITTTTIVNLLNGKGTTFAGLDYQTEVKTAAKHKDIKILKSTTANVTLFRALNDYDTYRKSVIKSARKIQGQENLEIDDFQVSESWFSHDVEDCFSVIHDKKTGEKAYLYAIFNSAKSEFSIDGEPATREMVADYLTPSEAKKLIEDNSVIHNKKNDILHTIQCRTIGLENIKEIRACKDILQA